MRLCSLALFAALLVLASCVAPVDTNQAAGPLSLSVVSGNNQTGPPGTELPAPIVALVEDSRGHAVKGQIVNFVVVSGGGSVFAGAAITSADGIVQERWTLGFSGPQQVEARAVDNATGAKITFATFTATLTDVQPPVVSDVATSPANPTAGTPRRAARTSRARRTRLTVALPSRCPRATAHSISKTKRCWPT